MGFDAMPGEVEKCVDFVSANPARFVFIAVGSPRQEIVAYAIRRSSMASGLGLCIGTSINFLVGAEKRAPVWMQRAGFEWLSRLVGSPRRLWRRYLIECPKIFPLMLEDYIAAFTRRPTD
jgi:exopolysaccharide biosynthesis WecB/TagA/CpsF family protein